MRKILVILLLVIVLVAGIVAWVLGPYYFGVTHITADPAKGYHADFYVWVPASIRKAASQDQRLTILVQPNNSGTNSDNSEIHRRDAWWTGFGRSRLAEELQVVLLVPAFLRPARDWHIYSHALDRDVLTTNRPDLSRLDLQLLAMVDETRERLARKGFLVDEQILIQGYSASAMFANRFTALHPGRVKAVAAGSPGGWPIAPCAEHEGFALVYPAGLADIEELTGTPFQSSAYKLVPQLLVMGDQDSNDSLDFGDGWEKETAATVDQLFGDDPQVRWSHAQSLYQNAGANAQFVLVEGVGHDRRVLQHLTTKFFAKILATEKK